MSVDPHPNVVAVAALGSARQGRDMRARHAGTPVLDRRRAGIVLHPTSLWGGPDTGDLSHPTYRFIEFLAASGISVWQTLPLGPTHDDLSPYQNLSVHAGNPRLISLHWLRDRGLLVEAELCGLHPAQAMKARRKALTAAHGAFRQHASAELRDAYARFREAEADWLDDYALYSAIRRDAERKAWTDWSPGLRDREPAALAKAQQRLAGRIDQIRFEQFVFFQQWAELKNYAHQNGIRLLGDMPIFVAHDSADVWAQRDYFTIDEHGKPEGVAGVPPDYFSASGQLWGNPLYRWDAIQADAFHWWIRRMQTQLKLFDMVRIDHFRGFQAYWAIPADHKTAQHGHWVEAPGKALLTALHDAFDALPLVAEDLGTITPQVEALRDGFGIPGMRILQFAFDGSSDNPYLPHNHIPNSVVYTGTHDNDTSLGWYKALPQDIRQRVDDYLGHPRAKMPWPLIRAALASPAKLALFPLQDALGLGKKHRMNRPGTTKGNWRWRFSEAQLSDELAAKLRHLVELYGRG